MTQDAGGRDYGFVLFRNSLVLALHALACVAGFIAGSSLPQIARRLQRALAQACTSRAPAGDRLRGRGDAVLARDAGLGPRPRHEHDRAQFGLSPASLLAMLSLHAVPELTALFLPLAAWTMASRRKHWEDLLAATFATLMVSIPVLLAAAAVEVWVTPPAALIRSCSG